MTTIVIDAPRFDLAITETLSYQGIPRYLVRYGLEAKRCDTLKEALDEFQGCLSHATSMLYDTPEALEKKRLPPGYDIDYYLDSGWLFFDANGGDESGFSSEEEVIKAAWSHHEATKQNS